MTAAGVLWLSPRFSSWIGSWKQALDLAAGSTGFIGPFAAGAACLAYARLRRSAVTELMAQGRHDLRVWVRPAVAVWSLACAALLTVALGATTLASLGGVPSYWGSVWILLPALVVVGAQTAIGAAIGFRSGRTWTAPMAVAGVYSVSLLMSSGVVPEVFDTGGVTGTLGGERFVPGPIWAPALAGLGIAVVVLAAAHPPMAWATWSRRVVVAAGGAALVTGWVMVSNDNDSRYELVADPAVTCAGSAPQVCVFAETPRPLEDLAEQVRRQAEPLPDAGVDLPGRFVQSYAGHRDGSVDGVVSLSVGEETGRTVDAASATQTLVTPAACPQDWSDLPSEEAFDARHLLGRWLQVRSGLRTPGADDSDGAWLTGDLGEQAAWVRTTYRLLRTCDFERIQMPDGVG